MAENDAIGGWLDRYVTSGGIVRLPDGAERVVQIGELCAVYVRRGYSEWSDIALICRSGDGELSPVQVRREHAAQIVVSDDGNAFSACISCGHRAALDPRCAPKCSPTCTAESPGGDLGAVGQTTTAGGGSGRARGPAAGAELGPELGRGEEAAGTQPLPTQRGNGPARTLPEHPGGNPAAATAGPAKRSAQRKSDMPAKKKKTVPKGAQEGSKGQGREAGVEAMPTDAAMAAERASTAATAEAAGSAAAAAGARRAAAEAAEAAAAAADAGARSEEDETPEVQGLGQEPLEAADRSEFGDGPDDRDAEHFPGRPGNMGPPTPRARRGPGETPGARRGNARGGAEDEYGAPVEARAGERAIRNELSAVGLHVTRTFLGTACAQCVHPNKAIILDQLAERLQARNPVYQSAEVAFIETEKVIRCWDQCPAVAGCTNGRPLSLAPP